MGLVDELRLLVYPVALGAGDRRFGETQDKIPLRKSPGVLRRWWRRRVGPTAQGQALLTAGELQAFNRTAAVEAVGGCAIVARAAVDLVAVTVAAEQAVVAGAAVEPVGA